VCLREREKDRERDVCVSVCVSTYITCVERLLVCVCVERVCVFFTGENDGENGDKRLDARLVLLLLLLCVSLYDEYLLLLSGLFDEGDENV